MKAQRYSLLALLLLATYALSCNWQVTSEFRQAYTKLRDEHIFKAYDRSKFDSEVIKLKGQYTPAVIQRNLTRRSRSQTKENSIRTRTGAGSETWSGSKPRSGSA